MQIHSDRTYELGADHTEVWAAMSRVQDYPRWWPWLRDFDGEALATGQVWSCVVQPPLPYALSFRVCLDEVVDGRTARATVDGDLGGDALLEVAPTDEGCRVRLRSALAPRRRALRTVAGLAPPVARYGHDWVLDTGLQQFRDGLGQA